MKIKNIIISIICALIFPIGAFAISKPTVSAIPSQVDANIFTLTINVDNGSKVTVVGGPSPIAPVTDGEGSDALDGVVKITVGLAQEQANVFSIAAEKGGVFSDSITVTINEASSIPDGQTPKGDTTPPTAPTLDTITNPVKAYKYTITGSTEADANIYVKNPDGSKAGSTQANANGLFSVTVDLVIGKTNRFNVSAEDAAYNVGPVTQAVIQAVQPDTPKEEEEEEEEVTTTTTSATTALSHPFTDITGHWAETYISEIYDDGIASGKTATTFVPDTNITRAELAKIVLNAFGYTVSDTAPTSDPFPDVSKDAWYASYVAAAKKEGITDGYPDGTFKPNDPVNRASALKMLVIASGLDYLMSTADFDDVKNSDWFANYVGFAQTNDIVGGYSDDTFRPANFITRAEVSKITIKLLELVE